MLFGSSIELEVSKKVEGVLKERGLKKGEVKKVVENAESTGKKLKDEAGERFLAKSFNENLTTYAVYEAMGEDEFKLLSGYAHKMKIEGPTQGVEDENESEWFCNKCDEKTVEGNVDLSYLGVTRPAPGVMCPECKDSYIMEDIVTGTLPAAEGILEEKRA